MMQSMAVHPHKRYKTETALLGRRARKAGRGNPVREQVVALRRQELAMKQAREMMLRG